MEIWQTSHDSGANFYRVYKGKQKNCSNELIIIFDLIVLLNIIEYCQFIPNNSALVCPTKLNIDQLFITWTKLFETPLLKYLLMCLYGRFLIERLFMEFILRFFAMTFWLCKRLKKRQKISFSVHCFPYSRSFASVLEMCTCTWIASNDENLFAFVEIFVSFRCSIFRST